MACSATIRVRSRLSSGLSRRNGNRIAADTRFAARGFVPNRGFCSSQVAYGPSDGIGWAVVYDLRQQIAMVVQPMPAISRAIRNRPRRWRCVT
jgi:hypothetical protein